MKYQCGETTIEQQRISLALREPGWTATLGDLSATAPTQRGVHEAMYHKVQNLRLILVDVIKQGSSQR